MFHSNILFWSLLILSVIEQIIYWQMFDYPYRYGQPIKTISLPKIDMSWWLSTKHSRIYVKKDLQSDDLYLRFKYGFGSLGPLLFVGRINVKEPDKLRINVGYVTSIFIFWMALPLEFTAYTILNAIFLLMTVIVFYYRFVSGVRKSINPITKGPVGGDP